MGRLCPANTHRVAPHQRTRILRRHSHAVCVASSYSVTRLGIAPVCALLLPFLPCDFASECKSTRNMDESENSSFGEYEGATCLKRMQTRQPQAACSSFSMHSCVQAQGVRLYCPLCSVCDVTIALCCGLMGFGRGSASSPARCLTTNCKYPIHIYGKTAVATRVSLVQCVSTNAVPEFESISIPTTNWYACCLLLAFCRIPNTLMSLSTRFRASCLSKVSAHMLGACVH